jgi:hypothetical protein
MEASRTGVSTHKLKDLQVHASRMAYCKVAADLVTYGLGVIDGSIKEFSTECSPEMVCAGKELLASLQKLSTDDQDNALQSFLFSLFNQQQLGEPNKYSFLAFNFLVLYSFTELGQLQYCGTITQHFAKVIFFGRLAVAIRAMTDAARDNKGFHE